jgi:hypothetical protein
MLKEIAVLKEGRLVESAGSQHSIGTGLWALTIMIKLYGAFEEAAEGIKKTRRRIHQ